jgi:superfamily I DNA/RNA helicase
MKHKPTDEQEAIIEAFATGENVVVNAGAGTGKTSTCVLMADETNDKGAYIAYNRSIANEAKRKMPRNVQVATAHSFAFRALNVGQRYGERLNQKTWPEQAAYILGIRDAIKVGELDGQDVYLSTQRQAAMVYEMIQRFCYSVDVEPGAQHMARVNGVDDNDAHWELANYLAPFALKAWKDLISEKGKLGWNKMHDIYLTMWVLTNPTIPAEFVLFDEAQDANPRTASLVLNQQAQLIAVGDQNQQIYEWRGAQDAMANWPAEHRLMLSQSFRFGQPIADEANKWLTLLDAELRLTGFDAAPSVLRELPDPDAVLCRTNASVIAEALQAQEKDKRVAIVGGTREIMAFAKAVQKLQANQRTEHPDLAIFKNWQQVKEYVEKGDGGDLKVLVKLIEQYGVEVLLKVANTAVDEEYADITLSTAHKAKGREWNNVRIGNDFTAPEADPETGETKVNRPECMLAYVAVTRAMRVLDRTGLNWVDALLPDTNTVEGTAEDITDQRELSPVGTQPRLFDSTVGRHQGIIAKGRRKRQGG